MKQIFNYMFGAIFVLLVLQACGRNESPSAAELLEDSCPAISEILWDTTSVLAPGVSYNEISLTMADGVMQHICIVGIEPDCGYGLNVVLPDNNTDISGGWRRQTLTSMADVLENGGQTVVAMTNADFWDTSEPINPRGPLHCGGKVVNSSWDYSDRVPQQALSFAGILNDGTPVIRDSSFYTVMKPELAECTGAGVIMLSGGEVTEDIYNLRDPRTAIGYGPDGTIWLLVADGRGFSGASGLTYREMGEMFRSLGCEAAVNLDGGGSAQMLVRDPHTGIFRIANSPSDGRERPVVSGLAIIKK